MQRFASHARRSALPTAFLATTAAYCLIASPALAEPTMEEMWEIVQKQQKQIDALTQQLESADAKVEATAAAVEDVALSRGSIQSAGWWDRTSIGGYGELHYNGGNTDRLDFHRFVLFVGHQFNDRLRLHTELELEHALAKDTGDGSGPGEVELEQAWLEYDFTSQLSGRAGLYLLPIGIINETHEPPTFYGVERNRVESNIIPSTWWEGGAGMTYRFANGVQIDGHVHGGLDVPITGGSAFRIRNGRQKVAQSTLREPAFTGRIKYTGIPGIELATSLQYQTDLTQNDPGDPKTSAMLWEAHVVADRAITPDIRLGLRALYARWDLNGSAADAAGRDKQYGWYVEPSVRFTTAAGDVGLYGRYSEDDNTAGDAVASKFKQISIGSNYWIHPNAVLKLEYEFQNPPPGSADDDKVHLGLGFQF
jgi:hypothetical protein